jgi:hypothetical protein
MRDDVLVDALLKATLFVCSREAIKDNGEGFVPLVFERGDESLLGVFTDIEHAKLHAAEAPFWIQMNGITVIRQLPPAFGLVVNPGENAGFELPAWGIGKIRARLDVA